MTWKPLTAARHLGQRIASTFHGDLPTPIPPPDMATVIREAKQADIERNAARQELADMRAKIAYLTDVASAGNPQQDPARQSYVLRAHELQEARQMVGAGPWLHSGARAHAASPDLPTKLRETTPLTAVGAFGDIDFALQNVEWRREINLSWLEFSRWGIQQLILISRLYYLKHPWIRRGVNLSAAYVFGQGVELSSPDQNANEVLRAFMERNKKTLGLIALTEAERRKSTDGNLFWVLFTDKENSGDVNVRSIDATEIQEIISDPDDADRPWFYRRLWTSRDFNFATGSLTTSSQDAWYPALSYDPEDKPKTINGTPVRWDSPIHHRKCGHVAKWQFGCPRVYPALDWAREGRRFLEAFASVWQALQQIALKITTKGGQQALAGIKQQMETTVGPGSPIWDANPPAGYGSTFASGPGTKIEAFNKTGAGGRPDDVKEFRNMVACVLEIPPTWLGDMETSNLSTAQTLDRPTELGFLTKQEEWQEDLVIMGRYQLQVSARATNGKLREAYGPGIEKIEIREAARRMKDCHWVYEAAKVPNPAVIEVMATFPSIREGDIPAQIGAVVQAMTLGNKGGQVVGIDERAGVLKLSRLADIDTPDEVVEDMYPDSEYDPDRTQEIEPAPIPTAPPISPGGKPQLGARGAQPPAVAPKRAGSPKKSSGVAEASTRLAEALRMLSDSAELVETGTNGQGGY